MIVIQKYRIIGTESVIHVAYERSSVLGAHASISFIGDECFGRIGTKRPPAEIDALPAGPERIARVGEWYEAEYQRAYTAILTAHPELRDDPRTRYYGGEIELSRSCAICGNRTYFLDDRGTHGCCKDERVLA